MRATRYMREPANFTEPHDSRMVRKFGSMEAFERVKAAHGLIPRGAEVGLDASMNYTQEQVRKQASILPLCCCCCCCCCLPRS